MDVREFAEQAVAVGTGVTVIGGGMLWLVREKVGDWVDQRVERQLAPLEEKVSDVDARVGHIEQEASVTGETIKNLAESIKDHMQRQTTAITTISFEVTAQGKELAKVVGAMEARDLRR
jgi:septal ring factor EnvC (AmiA/AmiB activator)